MAIQGDSNTLGHARHPAGKRPAGRHPGTRAQVATRAAGHHHQGGRRRWSTSRSSPSSRRSRSAARSRSRPIAFDQGQKVGAIATCINLLDGDITTAIDPAYGTNADDPVRQYHEDQVKEAKEIVDRNLKLVADLVERLWDKLSER